jgi:uncharacterized OB-fold protein
MLNTPYTQRFWKALDDDTFFIHRCEVCDERYFPPIPICPHCQSDAVGWIEASGTGAIYSFTRQHVTGAEFNDSIVAGIIELDEGVRILTRIDEPYNTLSIGDRVKIIPIEYDQEFDRGWTSEFPYFAAITIDPSEA